MRLKSYLFFFFVLYIALLMFSNADTTSFCQAFLFPELVLLNHSNHNETLSTYECHIQSAEMLYQCRQAQLETFKTERIQMTSVV